MKKTILSLSIIAVLASCGSSKNTGGASGNTNNSNAQATMSGDINTLSATEQSQGWRLLFDGKTTNGWHTYGKNTVGNAWKVADGNLYLDASNKKDWQTQDGGDIVTNDEFENYHLKLEWKISPNGNSGIIFNVKEDPQYQYSWYTGMEMQVLDNDGHADGKIEKHRAANLYDLIAVSKENVKPVGEWNLAEIVNNRGKLDLYLNGEKVVDTRIDDDAWKTLVAGSKFKDMPGFAKFTKGRIGLQDHGDNVWFRNIKIKQL